MIKATELRIGNYISDIAGGACTVRGITKNGIWIKDNGFVAPGSSFNPIDLTEEWLVKFGFTNGIEEELPEDAVFLCYFKDNIDVEVVPNKLGGVEVEGITLYEDVVDEEGNLASQGCYIIKSNINYVHQLQNLYFALTGEELTVK